MNKLICILVFIIFGLGTALKSQSTDPAGCIFQGSLYSDSSEVVIGLPFVLFIRDNDATGCQLYVQYSTQTGNPYPVKPSTIIRLLDDYNSIIDQGGSGLVPFLQNGVNFSVNREWVEAVYEGSGGRAMIIIRDGRTRFLTDESYEIIRARFIVCPPTYPPSYLIDAENGLYVANDTMVRMGGFLIEPTRIETNGFNWQMIDTLTSQEFGLTYNSPLNGDTAAYMARRWLGWRQVMEMGQKRWISEVRDTSGGGGDWSQVSHGITNGTPVPYFLIESSNAANTVSTQLVIQKNFAGWTMRDALFNPNYTVGFQSNTSTVSLGINDLDGPGNGVVFGAYGFGSTHYLYAITNNVDEGTATAGQFLQLTNAATGRVEFATVDLSGYLLKTDTAAMLLNYPSTTGWGLVDGGKTWRVDSSKVASRYYAATLPTSIAATQIAVSNGTNLVGYSGLTFNGSTTFGFGGTAFSFTNAGLVNAGVTDYNGYLTLRLNRNSTINGASSGNSVSFTTNSPYDFYTSAGLSMKLSAGGGGNTLWVPNGASTSYSSNQGIGTVGAIVAGGGTLWGGNPGVLIPANSLVSEGGLYTGVTSFTQINSNLILQTVSTTKASLPWPLMTTVQANAVTGIQGGVMYETDAAVNGIRWNNGTRKAYAVEGTFARGGAARVPYFDGNGQIVDISTFTFTSGNALLKIGKIYLNSTTGGDLGYYGTDPNVGLDLTNNAPTIRTFVGAISFRYTSSGGYTMAVFNPVNGRLAGNLAAETITGAESGDFRPSTQGTVAGGANGNDLIVRGGNAKGNSGAVTHISGDLILRGGYNDITALGGLDNGEIIFQTATNTIGVAPLQRGKIDASGKWQIGASTTAARTLHVNGEVRITDLTTDTPTKIVGADGDGDLGDIVVSTGLNLSGNVLTATASAPTQILAESYNRITSTSSPQTFSSTISDNLVDQGATQASFTFDFPASPVDGQVLTITWNNAISTLTLNGNGNTIVGSAVTTAVAGSQRKFKYCGTCSTPAWIKIY